VNKIERLEARRESLLGKLKEHRKKLLLIEKEVAYLKQIDEILRQSDAPLWEQMKQERPSWGQELLDQYRESKGLPPLDIQSLKGRRPLI
jgi:hypothetical protein